MKSRVVYEILPGRATECDSASGSLEGCPSWPGQTSSSSSSSSSSSIPKPRGSLGHHR